MKNKNFCTKTQGPSILTSRLKSSAGLMHFQLLQNLHQFFVFSSLDKEVCLKNYSYFQNSLIESVFLLLPKEGRYLLFSKWMAPNLGANLEEILKKQLGVTGDRSGVSQVEVQCSKHSATLTSLFLMYFIYFIQ